MALKWIKYQKAAGIRYREHETRTAKIGGRAKDRYWQLVYRYQGEPKFESLGWESRKMPEEKVVIIAAGLASNRKQGLYPQTFAELRALNEEEKKRKLEELAAA